ncbi:MAG: ArsR family transcriptional regulator [Candidatus Krumholzibacteriota bacterium]|nr:ArsR family transcriptional regulator [Candidatus Krumholzibacteriota bacterium]
MKDDRNVQGYRQVADTAKLFADPLRLEIIEILAQGPRTVDSLAVACDQPLKNVSHHLRRLLAAGLVKRVKSGRRAIYSIADERVTSLWVMIRRFAEDRVSATMDIDWDAPDRTMNAEDLARLVARREVLVIDVRPPEEFASGHLPGAVSIPEEEIEARLNELPRDRPVVAFCRGPYCLLADRAVDLLRASGMRALRCAGGVAEWRSLGLSVEAQGAAPADETRAGRPE